MALNVRKLANFIETEMGRIDQSAPDLVPRRHAEIMANAIFKIAKEEIEVELLLRASEKLEVVTASKKIGNVDVVLASGLITLELPKPFNRRNGEYVKPLTIINTGNSAIELTTGTGDINVDRLYPHEGLKFYSDGTNYYGT